MHWDRAQQRVCGGNPKLHIPSSLSTSPACAIVLGKAARCTGTARSSLDVHPGDCRPGSKTTKSLKPLWVSCCLLAQGLHNGICFVSRGSKGDSHLCPAVSVCCAGPWSWGEFHLFLNPRAGLAPCSFPPLIPQQWGVGSPHLHSGYTALAN